MTESRAVSPARNTHHRMFGGAWDFNLTYTVLDRGVTVSRKAARQYLTVRLVRRCSWSST